MVQTLKVQILAIFCAIAGAEITSDNDTIIRYILPSLLALITPFLKEILPDFAKNFNEFIRVRIFKIKKNEK